MEKETVLAKLRVSMGFTESTQHWLRDMEKNPNVWFAKEGGALFFSEYRGLWEKILINSSKTIIDDYFLNLGLPHNKLPHLVVYESYSGSWIMEAAIVMFASIGSAYTLLKGISELPKIADGLTELKDRLKMEFSRNASKEAFQRLNSAVNPRMELPSPNQIIYTDFTLDARPILSLSPSIMLSHKIHINAAISRDCFTLENLGQDIMRNIQIGIFKSLSPKNQWSFGDSYMGVIDLLSSQQTLTKDNSDFRNASSQQLDLSDNVPLYIDCWIQDAHGIYLLNFFLEG